MSDRTKSIITAGLWAVTILLAGTVIFRTSRSVEMDPIMPDPGSALAIDSINRVFGSAIESDEKHWLLVLTSSCPVCLALDTELEAIKDGATCEGATVVPLVVEMGQPVDSIKKVLAAHGLPVSGTAPPPVGFIAVRTRAVPAVISLDGRGIVQFAAVPVIEPWPPTSECTTQNSALTPAFPGSSG